MILSDYTLEHEMEEGRLYIDPVYHDSVRQSGIDFHLGTEIARANNLNVLDMRAKTNPEEWFRREHGLSFVVQPYEKVLCRTVEFIRLPTNLIGLCYLRSTFARLGMFIPPTAIDAGFYGTLTIELFGSSFPVKLYAYERFMHVLFSPLDTPSVAAVKYPGKYKGQIDVTVPIMDEAPVIVTTEGGKKNGNV